MLVVAVLAALAAWRLPWRRPQEDAPLGRFAKSAVTVTLVLLAAGFLIFFLQRDLFVRNGHAAAVLLFAGIIAVVAFNARDFAAKRSVSLWWNRYTVMALAMTVSIVGSVTLYLLGVPYAALIVEALLITEFAVFWGMRTAELRNMRVRPQQNA